MNHKLLLDFMHLLFEFEKETNKEVFSIYTPTIMGFEQWVRDKKVEQEEEEQEGVPSSIPTEQNIALSFFKLANYNKLYWRSLLVDSPFFMHDNLIFLMNLEVYGEMTKMELIRKSTQEKPTGMQIVNRLIELGFVMQKDSVLDKRSKMIEITPLGQLELTKNKDDIQCASQGITGNLNQIEKDSLFYLLSKLTDFHEGVFNENRTKEELIQLIGNYEK